MFCWNCLKKKSWEGELMNVSWVTQLQTMNKIGSYGIFHLVSKVKAKQLKYWKYRSHKTFVSILLVFLFFFFQTISVSVSVLTLSCIAQDRWYAICHPLMFKSTAKRARKSIVVIWVVSCVIMIPQAIVMECSSLLPELTNKTSLFTVCDEHWGG